MSKILVTGGCGDIGFYLASRLLELDNNITIVDNLIRGRLDESMLALLAQPNIEFVKGDLCNQDFVNSLPDDFAYVYHLAAFNGTANFYEKPFTVLENSTLPAVLLLKHLADGHGLKRFFYAASSEAYASTVKCFNWPVPTDETVPLCIDDPTNVRWSYAASKLHGEIAAFAAAAQFGLPVTVGRLHNIYSPRTGDKHVIPDFIARAEKGIYELFGYADTRSFTYVTDAVEACILAAESPQTINEIVNIGSEDETSMLELGKLILKLMGKGDEEITRYPSPSGSVPRRAPSMEKLRVKTGFVPKVSLEEGLKKFLAARAKES